MLIYKLLKPVLVAVVALMVAVPMVRGALVISYAVTDSTIGDGSASGTILDNGNVIGSWAVSGFSFAKLSPTEPFTPSIGTITAATSGNSYNKPGIGISIIGNGAAADGVTYIQYTVSWSLNAGYTLDSTSFWGKYPNTVGAYGPANPINGGGSISLSGFTGQGLVSDPSDNLNVADNYLFSSGEDLGGWKNSGSGSGDWAAASVNWQLFAPSASSYTFILDYSDQNLSTANEATAFNFNISEATAVPEPGTWVAGALLLGGAALWRYRRRRGE